jgi:prepilin-type N-terminal cleavage/methylation domain-containing protein
MQQMYPVVRMTRKYRIGRTGSGHLGGGASGFTLVEILLVIAIIGVMSALVLTTIGNAARDSHEVVARQQQVSLQQALNAWINSSGNSNSVTVARTRYNAAANQGARLALIRDYLAGETYDHLTNASSADQIRSTALQKSGRYLVFSAWTTTNYPSVNMLP